MKILFDFDIFYHQKFGGISRYFFDNIKYFNDNNSLQWDLPIKYSQNEYLSADCSLGINTVPLDHQYTSFLGGKDFKGKGRLYTMSQQWKKDMNPLAENIMLSNKAVSRGDFDVFHPTYYSNYYLEALGDKKLVLTVYDMIHEIYPELFGVNDNTSIVKKKLVERADKVIAISHSTKKDLMNVYGMPGDKIEVVHLSSSFGNYDKAILTQYKPDFNYILFTGNRSIYKNFYSFVRAISPILRKNKDLKLLCTGSTFSSAELELFKQLEISNNVVHHYAHDQELAALYTYAEVFVFPSYYEGFGIPMLEAFQCGCPVVASNVSSLPEVGQEGALYFSPKDYAQIHDQVNAVLFDTELKNKLVDNGQKRLNDFSIQKVANQTIEVYNKVLVENS
jgi:glycosyltransferase involved in cell wall biosynthesis